MRLETSLESSCELELASENELHLLLTHLSHVLHSMHSGIVKLPKKGIDPCDRYFHPLRA